MKNNDETISTSQIPNKRNRVESTIPKLYRLCKRNDELFLQGGYEWFSVDGIQHGIDWRDIEFYVYPSDSVKIPSIEPAKITDI